MKKKHAAFLIAKILFAGFVVNWLLHKIDATRVWHTIQQAAPGRIALATFLCWCGVIVAGWRWHRLLMTLEIRIPLRDLFCIAQIGQFFLMFLPGPTGDDLTRMLYISRLAKGRVGTACTAVLLDRCIGLASILILAVVCVPVQWDLLNQSAQTRWLAISMLAGGTAVVLAALVFFGLPAGTTKPLIERLRARLPDFRPIREILQISSALQSHKRAVGEVFAAAVSIQFILCCVYYLAGQAVGINASLFVWLSFVPIVLVANAVPITIAGFGVREYLFVLFLANLAQIEAERALAASLIVLAITLVVCLAGGLVYVLYRSRSARLETL
jgi:uncharacterized protein (TIRG00374 family)